MVHTNRPLQEKMTLFWHNHFATAYSKIAGTLGAAEGARATWRRSRPRIRGGVRGQIEMLRDNALGNFRDLLVDIAQGHRDARSGSTAGTNTRARPQENFGREIMELFTMGVGQLHRSRRVRGRARLHRLEPARPAPRPTAQPLPSSSTTPRQHDTAAKTFSFRDLSGRRQDDSGARGRRGACRTAST